MRAAILILSFFCQLILTTTILYDGAANQEDVIFYLDTMNYYIAFCLYEVDNNEINNESPYDIDYLRNKLHDLQNNVTKLYEEIYSNPENYEEIMERRNLIEHELSNLSNNLRTKQDLQQNSFPNFITSLKNQENSTEKLAKLKLEKDFNEFLEAIKYQNYQFALIKFLSIKNETMARDFVISVYKKLNNVDFLLKFTDNLNDMNKKLFIYKSLFEAVNYKISSLIDICKLFKIRMKLYYSKTDKVPNELQTVANNMLAALDKRIEIWLTLFTCHLNQDLIVKIKYHSKLYGPVNYVHNITYPMERRRQDLKKGRRTAILSCYPL